MKNHKYIQEELAQKIDDINVEYFETIGSTNDCLLEKEFTARYHFCYADIQTKARGRRGGKSIQMWDSRRSRPPPPESTTRSSNRYCTHYTVHFNVQSRTFVFCFLLAKSRRSWAVTTCTHKSPGRRSPACLFSSRACVTNEPCWRHCSRADWAKLALGQSDDDSSVVFQCCGRVDSMIIASLVSNGMPRRRRRLGERRLKAKHNQYRHDK